MENLKVVDLKEIAKSRGLRGYSKLRKAELIDLLTQRGEIIFVEQPEVIFVEEPEVIFVEEPQTCQPEIRDLISAGSLLDEPIPEDEISKKQTILKPTKAKLTNPPILKPTKVELTNKEWEDWLLKPQSQPKARVVDKDHESFKERIKELYSQNKIIKICSKTCKKFKTYFDAFRATSDTNDIDKTLFYIMNKVRRERELVKGDKIRVILSHNSWRNPMSTKLIAITDHFGIDVIENIARYLEYKDVPLSEVKIEIQTVKIPRAKGRLRPTKSNVSCKKSIITIKNNDSMCLARSIVTAVANINKHKWTKSQLKNGFNNSRTLQKDEAIKLHEKAGVEINEFGSTLEDINRFAKHLNVQINIIDGDQFNELIFTSENEYDNGQMIYLFKNNNHFDVITSMPGFLAKNYYCHTCKKSYTKRDCHKCPSKCIACFKYFPDGKGCSGEEIKCINCNRTFFGEKCFEEHKRDRSSKGIDDIVCEKVCKCLKCEKTVVGCLKNHVCGYSKCKNCGEYCNMNEHLCFMTQKSCKGGKCTGCSEKKKCYSCKTRTDKYMFYDFEANQESGVHAVDWVDCQDFYGKITTFVTIDEFCKFVFNKEHIGFTFIAHNSKGYDAHFIRNWCVENGVKPYIIYNGLKIMYMEVEGVKFIDSLNFIAASLSSFPKTFGLTELKKGYFPHYFNKKCNQNYVGKIPAPRYFGVNQMRSSVREDFLKWHKSKVDENYVFDFKRELREYCRSDVDILRRSMLKFREDFIELENIDPLQYITIASVCMTIFRSNYMPSKEIGVVNEVSQDTFSKISIAWLDWISQGSGLEIKHALNGGEEQVLPGIGKVDGFCGNTVYEFQGCFWHGCEKCYSRDTINTKNQMDMLTLRKRTREKCEKIVGAGYKLVEVWECDLAKDIEFKKFFKTWDREIISPLNPRDAFFGGRTNITKLTYDFKEGERGRYVDFVSLYPTVQFFKEYPIKHPTKIFTPEEYEEKWFGFVKCKVLPPRGLYHPVLPVKIKCGDAEKLLFPLCKVCVEKKIQRCDHSDDERSFVGTWCTNELAVAIAKGYKIQKIFEVWDFKEKSDNLFKGYVRKFMKIKMESSELKTGDGFTYKNEEEYKSVVKSKLGIKLDEIKPNPGMRQIAKLCLNSLWGKFGQRNNMKQTVYVTEPSEFYKILLDDSIDDLNIQFINDDMVEMTYNLKGQFVDNSKDTNIFVAAFTTSHARMMLYEVLDTLGDQVLGFDTDSAWYIERNGGRSLKQVTASVI